jgi:predicted DCC family thiol-disulfide oxidoreductase YuxK
MHSRPEETVIYFDGVCHLCHRSVRFIARRDPRKRFVFSPLQSPRGREIMRRLGMDEHQPGSIILAEGDRLYTRSTAALRIASRLRAPWPLLRVFWVIPRPIRDALYDWIARNRYRWFGKMEACPLPEEDLRDRFVGD